MFSGVSQKIVGFLVFVGMMLYVVDSDAADSNANQFEFHSSEMRFVFANAEGLESTDGFPMGQLVLHKYPDNVSDTIANKCAMDEEFGATTIYAKDRRTGKIAVFNFSGLSCNSFRSASSTHPFDKVVFNYTARSFASN